MIRMLLWLQYKPANELIGKWADVVLISVRHPIEKAKDQRIQRATSNLYGSFEILVASIQEEEEDDDDDGDDEKRMERIE